MDFPFDIYQVADSIGLSPRRYHTKSTDYDCPFCGDKGKLNLNVALNTYRCNRCDVKGGMLDLFCRCTGINDRKRAYQMLSNRNRNSFSQAVVKGRKESVNTIKEAEKADISIVDTCYRKLLNMLILKPEHRDNLRKRGLSDEAIDIYGYRSVPTSHIGNFAAILSKEFENLIGIPGFFIDKNGKIKINLYDCMAGFFVPVYNNNHQIQAMQIRLDVPLEGKRKYMWLSSAEKNGGCSSNSPVDISGDIMNSEAVYVTEGPLKGQTAHQLSGKPFLSIAGVSQQKELEPIFDLMRKSSKCKIIVDALDMDDNENAHVRKGHRDLVWLIEKYGFIPRRVMWDSKYKGIDDCLLSKRGG